MENSIHQSKTIYNYLKNLNLCSVFSHTVIKHILSILISVFSMGYNGKTVDFEKYSSCHRTTIAHFLNNGKWDDSKLQDVIKSAVVHVIYHEAVRSGKPILCIVDDTISSKTKPSLQVSASDRRCVFSSVTFKEKTGLWPSGSCCHAVMQWNCVELCNYHV